MQPDGKRLLRPALRIDQGGGVPVYTFSLTGDELLQVADIHRLGRSSGGRLQGYQRPEVRRHIQNIVDYLDGDDVLFPNAVILALSSEARFFHSPASIEDHTQVGTLEIPLPVNGDPRPAWIVDGQQRSAALSRSRRKNLPIPVSAFIADDIELQRDQFLRINSSKPLPRGLVAELLPEVTGPLPRYLRADRGPSTLCNLLNADPGSPFHGLIKRPSMTPGERRLAPVTDTVIIRLLRESFSQPKGCLFWHKNVALDRTDIEGARQVLLLYWNAVRDTFPDAWGLPPSRSRLMHGVGLRAMGRLMDRIMSSIDATSDGAYARVRRELAKVEPHCRWTSGRWEALDLRWNELQNLPAHVRMLSDFIVRTYLDAA